MGLSLKERSILIFVMNNNNFKVIIFEKINFINFKKIKYAPPLWGGGFPTTYVLRSLIITIIPLLLLVKIHFIY